jgi:hypothetical protein
MFVAALQGVLMPRPAERNFRSAERKEDTNGTTALELEGKKQPDDDTP